MKVVYREWLVDIHSHYDELNLEIPTFEPEDGSDFDISLDSWLERLTTEGLRDSATSKIIFRVRPELMLSPHIIRAPLRGARSDKRAELSA
jgi:hypothetical protein